MLQWQKLNVSSKNPIAAANHLGIPSYTEKDVFNLLAVTTSKLRKLLLYINHLCLPNFRGSPRKGLLQDVNSKGMLQPERCQTADPTVRKYLKWLKINTTCRFCKAGHCYSHTCSHGGRENGRTETPQRIRTGDGRCQNRIWQQVPGGSDSHKSACNSGHPGSIPGLGRSPGEGNGSPLQYSCLENPMDRRAWRATTPWGHTESDTTETT